MTGAARSSFADTDWLPLQESLLRGLNHALSNRLASIGALSMLLDAGERMDERLQQMLVADVSRLEGLLGSYRALTTAPEVRREPMRMVDALAKAATLVAQHQDARDLVLEQLVEAPGAEPVHLLSHDPVRASVTLLLAVARSAHDAPAVRVTVEGGDGLVRVTAARDGADEATIAACREFAMLERFAAAEGGRVSAASTAAGATISLTLPGLAQGRATGR